MTASTATADTPLQHAWLPGSHSQAGRLAAQSRERAHPGAPGWVGAIGDILFQICLGLSRLHEDTAGSPTRRRPQTWRSLFFAPWTSRGVLAVSSRTAMNNVG